MVRNDSTIVLHRGWRGGYIGATRTTGIGVAGDVPWPGVSWEVKHSLVDPREVHTWVGSVSMSHMDQSGLIYQRNRYYNPAAGQFTQGDPIGISGGLNLYGYAGGDPVNFSDPFGLRAGLDTIPTNIQQLLGDMCEKIDCNEAEIVTDGIRHATVMAASFGAPAVTLGNKIYMASPPDPDSRASMELVAHELTHVGQYQDWGALVYYIAGATDRFIELGGGDAYSWRGTLGELSERHRRMEQRAQIVQDCFRGSPRACALSPYTFGGGGR